MILTGQGFLYMILRAQARCILHDIKGAVVFYTILIRGSGLLHDINGAGVLYMILRGRCIIHDINGAGVF